MASRSSAVRAPMTGPTYTVIPVIRLRGVTKRYPNGTTAVQDLDLEVAEGEVCILVGPSGCGKTTTLRMINRLIEPSDGVIEVAGDDVRQLDPVQLRRRIGYVIQHVGLFPHQTVGDNVATVPRLLGWDRARVRSRVDELLDVVGLEPATYRDRYPAQLSGGQRQRVGVARALAADPPVLLMDEPFGAIDPVTRARLQQQFLELQRGLGKTVVVVTHDIDEAVLLGDRIALLEQGGVLAQYATPDELLTDPASEFVAGFVGADRGLKRLALHALDELLLEPAPEQGTEGLPRVPADADLRGALSAALLSPDGRVLVEAAGGGLAGIATLELLLAAARPRAAGELSGRE
jgi:osmoprotectant transport system ATP-binding protein